jgi:hypothetical protein
MFTQDVTEQNYILLSSAFFEHQSVGIFSDFCPSQLKMNEFVIKELQKIRDLDFNNTVLCIKKNKALIV